VGWDIREGKKRGEGGMAEKPNRGVCAEEQSGRRMRSRGGEGIWGGWGGDR